ncbi:MAG: ribonuclease P protein component [Pseudomonadota bacterium]|nr:ribonuclease P protein component [Pseudomonadota bacterium]
MRLETIKKRADFLAASARGRKVSTGTFLLLARARQDEGAPRFGFTVTKKLGNAVARNRIKRRLRESVRKAMEKAASGQDYVFIARPKALDCPYGEILRDMTFAFSKIATMKNGTAPNPTVSDARS